MEPTGASNYSRGEITIQLHNDSAIHHENTTMADGFHMDLKTRLILGFLGLLGFYVVAANSLVLLLYWRKPLLRKKSNAVLISLAVSDLLSGLVAIPLLIACSFSTRDQEPKCYAMDICQRFLSFSTILHLFAATMERYLRLLKPLHSLAIVTNQRLICVLLTIWCVAFTASAIQLAWIDLQDPTSTEPKDFEIVYSMTAMCALVLLPFVIMVVAFIHMFVVIRQKKMQLSGLVDDSHRAAKRNKRRKVERRSVLVYSAMTITYAIGWFPFFFVTYVGDYQQRYYHLPLWLDTFFLYSKFTTALFNPILYTFFKSDFQTALRSLHFSKRNNTSDPLTSQFHLSSLSRSRMRGKTPEQENSLL